MTRVLFDLAATQGYGSTKFHGGGEYAKRVFRDCVENLPTGTSLEAHLESARFTDPEIIEFAKTHRVKIHQLDSSTELESLLAAELYDRYYSALPTASGWDFAIPPETRFIFTLHGIRGLLTQDWRLRTKYGRTIAHGVAMAVFFFLFGRLRYARVNRRFARKISATENRDIITVSNYGKFSFMASVPGVDLSQVRILDSVTEEFAPDRDAAVLERASLSADNYFLLVSANRYEKNAFRALRAIDKLFSSPGHSNAFADC